ncbi:hypothetical protein T484DRAFT_2291978 [Baffinella frigidus]|nr:hypothetical protein T484DRAFT_2291978 [Cryptophyta sp. CCMP2293]
MRSGLPVEMRSGLPVGGAGGRALGEGVGWSGLIVGGRAVCTATLLPRLEIGGRVVTPRPIETAVVPVEGAVRSNGAVSGLPGGGVRAGLEMEGAVLLLGSPMGERAFLGASMGGAGGAVSGLPAQGAARAGIATGDPSGGRFLGRPLGERPVFRVTGGSLDGTALAYSARAPLVLSARAPPRFLSKPSGSSNATALAWSSSASGCESRGAATPVAWLALNVTPLGVSGGEQAARGGAW